jgi:hypothetical protein
MLPSYGITTLAGYVGALDADDVKERLSAYDETQSCLAGTKLWILIPGSVGWLKEGVPSKMVHRQTERGNEQYPGLGNIF